MATKEAGIGERWEREGWLYGGGGGPPLPPPWIQAWPLIERLGPGSSSLSPRRECMLGAGEADEWRSWGRRGAGETPKSRRR